MRSPAASSSRPASPQLHSKNMPRVKGTTRCASVASTLAPSSVQSPATEVHSHRNGTTQRSSCSTSTADRSSSCKKITSPDLAFFPTSSYRGGGAFVSSRKRGGKQWVEDSGGASVTTAASSRTSSTAATSSCSMATAVSGGARSAATLPVLQQPEKRSMHNLVMVANRRRPEPRQHQQQMGNDETDVLSHDGSNNLVQSSNSFKERAHSWSSGQHCAEARAATSFRTKGRVADKSSQQEPPANNFSAASSLWHRMHNSWPRGRDEHGIAIISDAYQGEIESDAWKEPHDDDSQCEAQECPQRKARATDVSASSVMTVFSGFSEKTLHSANTVKVENGASRVEQEIGKTAASTSPHHCEKSSKTGFVVQFNRQKKCSPSSSGKDEKENSTACGECNKEDGRNNCSSSSVVAGSLQKQMLSQPRDDDTSEPESKQSSAVAKSPEEIAARGSSQLPRHIVPVTGSVHEFDDSAPQPTACQLPMSPPRGGQNSHGDGQSPFSSLFVVSPQRPSRRSKALDLKTDREYCNISMAGGSEATKLKSRGLHLEAERQLLLKNCATEHTASTSESLPPLLPCQKRLLLPLQNDDKTTQFTEWQSLTKEDRAAESDCVNMPMPRPSSCDSACTSSSVIHSSKVLSHSSDEKLNPHCPCEEKSTGRQHAASGTNLDKVLTPGEHNRDGLASSLKIHSTGEEDLRRNHRSAEQSPPIAAQEQVSLPETESKVDSSVIHEEVSGVVGIEQNAAPIFLNLPDPDGCSAATCATDSMRVFTHARGHRHRSRKAAGATRKHPVSPSCPPFKTSAEDVRLDCLSKSCNETEQNDASSLQRQEIMHSSMPEGVLSSLASDLGPVQVLVERKGRKIQESDIVLDTAGVLHRRRKHVVLATQNLGPPAESGAAHGCISTGSSAVARDPAMSPTKARGSPPQKPQRATGGGDVPSKVPGLRRNRDGARPEGGLSVSKEDEGATQRAARLEQDDARRQPPDPGHERGSALMKEEDGKPSGGGGSAAEQAGAIFKLKKAVSLHSLQTALRQSTTGASDRLIRLGRKSKSYHPRRTAQQYTSFVDGAAGECQQHIAAPGGKTVCKLAMIRQVPDSQGLVYSGTKQDDSGRRMLLERGGSDMTSSSFGSDQMMSV